MRYEIHLAGHVPRDELADELDAVATRPAVVHDECTVLSGSFPDQAALHGFLHELWGRRLRVVGVRRARARRQSLRNGT